MVEHISSHCEHKLDPLTQKRIHILCQSILKDSTVLKVPVLFESENPNEYWYETFDCLAPIFLSSPHLIPLNIHQTKLLEEFVHLWKNCYAQGILLFNFSLFAQPNGTVVIRNFDATLFKTTIGKSTLATFPDSSTLPILDVFTHDCFPLHFIQSIGFVPGE
jgi:hypothetical protein